MPVERERDSVCVNNNREGYMVSLFSSLNDVFDFPCSDTASSHIYERTVIASIDFDCTAAQVVLGKGEYGSFTMEVSLFLLLTLL